MTFKELADEGEMIKLSITTPLSANVACRILPFEAWVKKCMRLLKHRCPQSETLHSFLIVASDEEDFSIVKLEKLLFIIQSLALAEELFAFVG
ncbi:hypothetical protein GJ688_03325 [Heliobacillus mobilis]|uniref:Uncharacterized protein n=1 Tax=Heliobacterium mobile TaxID=28064 RepID=A0A6I3SGQ0_HELMO|nr:hypothetical protein [Heliobacterium mobile]MTV48010.1 hypothetical protein [Heliobacterium mobile]